MNYKEILKKALAKKKNGGNFNSFANSSGTQAMANGMTAASGAINSQMDWKMSDEYSVSDNPMQKATEGVMGAIPVANMFMGIGKIGEAGVDKVAPGMGESIFAPHKGILRTIDKKKPEYAIPVVGSVMAANDAKQAEAEKRAYNNRELNPYGSTLMRHGGSLPKYNDGGELIKYDAPSHEEGGQMIDEKGIPTNDVNNAAAEIEKKETSHKGYVFSDTLKAKNGKTFAAVSKMIDKKYKNKTDAISKKSRDISLNLLKGENEALRIQEEGISKEVPQMDNGGEIIPPKNNPNDIYGGDLFYSGAYFNTDQMQKLGMQHPNQVKTYNQQDLGVDTKESSGIPDLGSASYNVTPKVIDESKIDFTEGNTQGDLTSEVTSKDKKGMHYLTPARIGKGIELAGKAGILSAGYDKVNPEFNLEKRKVEALMRDRRVNSQSVLNEINLQRNSALASNQNTRSMNVKRALDSGVYNRAARQAMQARLQEDSQNNAYKGQEAATVAQLGTEEKQDKVVAADLTARNKGQWLSNLGTVLGDVGRAGAFETKVKVNDMQITEGLAMIGTKYEDYGIDADTIDRLTKGKYTVKDAELLADSLIKYKQKNGK